LSTYKRPKALSALTRQSRAVTLFELLVVLAIAFILVGMLFFSSRSVMTRTKVSRVKEEHRILARAIQNYTLDYSQLPPRLESLTHPTVYMAQLPNDPFNAQRDGYLYLNCPAIDVTGIIISPGPDGDFDLPPALWRYVTNKNTTSGTVIPTVRALAGTDEVTNRGREPMAEADSATLATYLLLGQYSAEKGNDGDIITVLR